MKLPYKSASILPALFFATALHAGPFGVDLQNDTPESLNCTKGSELFYRCATLPQTHPQMEFYNIRYHKGAGICSVQGIGNNISTNVFGVSVQSTVDDIAEQISIKYGSKKPYDFLLPGSIWDEPEDWMMGLLKSDRTYAYMFEPEEPVEGIKKAAVLAKALSPDTGYIVVEFLSENDEKCDELGAAEGASSF